MSGLIDARGCLTDQGLATLASASPGRTPDALVAHVAACARCQQRLLSASVPGGRAPVRRARSRKTMWISLAAVLGALLIALLALLIGAARLRGE